MTIKVSRKRNLIVVLLLFNLSSYCNLNRLAVKHGTHKSSKVHDYAVIYEKYFAPFRDAPIVFLEIGLGAGCSARMWDEYFSKAKLYFIDIVPYVVERGNKYLSAKAKCFLVDQSNKKALDDFAKRIDEEFDIIVDDGGHTMDQQLNSFIALFPYVKSGGIYVVEDLHTSYWEKYGGNAGAGEGTTIGFFRDLVNGVNFFGAKTGCASFDACPDKLKKTLSYYQKNIKSIHFYCSMCFIFKR